MKKQTSAFTLKALIFFLCFSALAAAAAGRDLQFSNTCQSSQDLVVISFVGDILIHDELYKFVVRDRQDFSRIWRQATPLFEKADYAIANLEGPAAMGIDRNGKDHGDVGFTYDKIIYSGTNFKFNYHPKILSDIVNSGIDLITLANNHSLDRKGLGIDRTLEAANTIRLPTVGTRHSQSRSGDFHKIVTIGGLKVAVIGCTEMTNGVADPQGQVLNCYKDASKIETLIQSLTSQTETILVYPHWGDEYNHQPDASQKSYARKFLEAGATAVIGSHPHVLQPWEKYITRDGRETLILYSLGNFVAFQASLPKKTGVVAYLALNQNGTQRGRIAGVAYTPTYRDGYEVYPVGNSGLSNARKEAETYFGTSNRLLPTESAHKKICSGN